MPTPNKKPTTKKKQSFFSRLKPTTKKAKILTTVAAFAVIGGGIMVYRSFATTTPDYTGGVMSWNFDGSRQSTGRISSNGTVCVDHLGIDTGSSGGSPSWFAVTLFSLVSGKWKQVKDVEYKFSKNLDRTDYERICWRGLNAAALYKVQFDPFPSLPFEPDRAFARLTYKVYGYDKANGQQSAGTGTTKNPPTPVPVSNPQPSK